MISYIGAFKPKIDFFEIPANNFSDDKIDKVVTKIIGGLSKIEDTYYAGRGLIFINIEAEEVHDITVSNVPSIVYFKNGHPHVYEGLEPFMYSNTSPREQI